MRYYSDYRRPESPIRDYSDKYLQESPYRKVEPRIYSQDRLYSTSPISFST